MAAVGGGGRLVRAGGEVCGARKVRTARRGCGKKGWLLPQKSGIFMVLDVHDAAAGSPAPGPPAPP